MAKSEPKTEEKIEAPQKPIDPMKDMVTVVLPRATGKEEDFIFVSLNGKGYTIKKGVPVRVPRPVYALLRESERQKERQAAYEERLQEQMLRSAQATGMA